MRAKPIHRLRSRLHSQLLTHDLRSHDNSPHHPQYGLSLRLRTFSSNRKRAAIGGLAERLTGGVAQTSQPDQSKGQNVGGLRIHDELKWESRLGPMSCPVSSDHG